MRATMIPKIATASQKMMLEYNVNFVDDILYVLYYKSDTEH